MACIENYTGYAWLGGVDCLLVLQFLVSVTKNLVKNKQSPSTYFYCLGVFVFDLLVLIIGKCRKVSGAYLMISSKLVSFLNWNQHPCGSCVHLAKHSGLTANAKDVLVDFQGFSNIKIQGYYPG